MTSSYPEEQRKIDEMYMERALALAARGRGTTTPNPMVGAVIVKDGRVIGEGYHIRAGEGHAEVNAFRNAEENGEDVTGATMYAVSYTHLDVYKRQQQSHSPDIHRYNAYQVFCKPYIEFHTVHHTDILFCKFYDEYTVGLYILYPGVLLYVRGALPLLIPLKDLCQ